MTSRMGLMASKSPYNSRWRKARESYLRLHPLCAMCLERGRSTVATVVDHIIPHRGDRVIFWNTDNWQALCKPCHDRHKQRIEAGGIASGCNAEGIPIDPGHHWHSEGRGDKKAIARRASNGADSFFTAPGNSGGGIDNE
ncbi:HNH endonuclease signature motif containing protein [Plasticicumulans acidivorans]|uniref:HNH endonuclease n=1 Tax=Plasticicumulans acidivorans TaxID=886464 RepID=UPI00319D8E02